MSAENKVWLQRLLMKHSALLFVLCRKAASVQQRVGAVRVPERRQPQRERPRQDGPLPAHRDLRDGSDRPAHCAGAPPLLSACVCPSFISERAAPRGRISCLWFLSQGFLLTCSESIASQSETRPIPDCLRWLFTPLGRQFFLSCDWSVRSESSDGVYTSQRDAGMLVHPVV